MSNTRDDLTKLADASGFAFQLAIEHLIRSQAKGWRIEGKEHPWSDSDSEGFIDLVISRGQCTYVLECKRTAQDATWLFYVPNGEKQKQTEARVRWINGESPVKFCSGCDSVEFLPESYQSAFCSVRGTGEKDTPMLERICSTLLASTEALLAQKLGIFRESWHGFGGACIPVIVTNAKLVACKFDPAKVGLADGKMRDPDFEEDVDLVRFTKAFNGMSGRFTSTTVPDHISDVAEQSTRTVFVVSVAALIKVLSNMATKLVRTKELPWRGQ